MKFLQILLILILIVNIDVNAQPREKAYLNQLLPIEERVKSALSLMTLQEKVALTHAQSKFSSAGVPRLGIPELWMTDGPHGIRAEVLWDSWKDADWTTDSCMAFPALTCLAATWNPNIAHLYGKAIGEEARYREKDVLLGPGVNIIRTPLNGRNFEYMGEDPLQISKMAVPYIKGVQENGVAACVKHFALNNQETWRDFINVEVSDRALHEIYLPAFKAAVQEGGALSIMAAYNKFRGSWCAENDLLLNKILKQGWGFKGAVISDWNAVHHTLDAVNNGLDIEMGTKLPKGKSYNDFYLAAPYLKALESGEARMKDLDDKVSRILRVIFATGMNNNKPFGSFATEEHGNVARKIAEEGIVLLQNKNEILPLDLGKIKSIAVIGENADRKMTVGGGSSSLKVKYEITPLEGLRDKFGSKADIQYAKGYSHDDKKEDLITEAVNIAKSADVVLYFGGLSKDRFQDNESTDRKDFKLPFGQDELINALLKVNKNVVIVLISGNAVEMPWVANVSAILQAWYGGSEAGNAIANIISGDVNPSGKLPFTINKKLEDYAAHSVGEYPGDKVNQIYKDDIYVGYRWNDTKNITPQFGFGHGLSYTNFSYSKLELDNKFITANGSAKVKLVVKNIGKVKGAEVIQLYVRDVESSTDRPFKELKAFQKVELNAGEEKEITFEISASYLQFYNGNGAWAVEPGMFQILVGSSSRDIRSKTDFVLR